MNNKNFGVNYLVDIKDVRDKLGIDDQYVLVKRSEYQDTVDYLNDHNEAFVAAERLLDEYPPIVEVEIPKDSPKEVMEHISRWINEFVERKKIYNKSMFLMVYGRKNNIKIHSVLELGEMKFKHVREKLLKLVEDEKARVVKDKSGE